MAFRTFYGYAPHAIDFSATSNGFQLKPSFAPARHRVRFEVGSGTGRVEETAPRQLAARQAAPLVKVYQTDGTVVGPAPIEVRTPQKYHDPSGETFQLTPYGVNGGVMAYVPDRPLGPGQSDRALAASASTRHGRPASGPCAEDAVSETVQPGVTCFGPGTMIATQEGEVPVEWLDTCDRVLTRDRGFQPILWVGQLRYEPSFFDAHPNARPVTFAPGSLGPNVPTHPLTVTADHRLLLRSASAAVRFSAPEVLAPAEAWVMAGRGEYASVRDALTATCIMLADHHVIMAEGAWVESISAGENLRAWGDTSTGPAQPRETGDPRAEVRTARPCVTAAQAAAVLSPQGRQTHVAWDVAPQARRA